MANYSYICFKTRTTLNDKLKETFELVLREAVLMTLDNRWHVRLCDHEDGGPTWFVYLPNTNALREPIFGDEDIGFMATRQPKAIAFRHSFDTFACWAQGRVAETLGDRYNLGVFYDSTDETHGPGAYRYRVGKTFGDYMTWDFEKPLSKADEDYLEPYKKMTPEGFW